ncbi:MAG TPA: hypothetical protein PKI20_08645 [Verrucomicrobiota bacterium]|nr:hypothetical protein [Verrucomicrobiota bacterium]HQL78187.1 hypothetical protein [Verrucomicrobiota bacterium]
MKNHEMVMSIRESQRLAELEKTIGRGQKTFVEVGLALAEIRDLRLYKREYSSFKEYCQKKWGWTKQHAYRLIEAAPIGKCHHVVTDEATARVLAGVEPSEREGLIGAVVEAGKPVTAAELKRHLPPPPMQRRAADGAPGAEPGAQKRSPRGDSFGEGIDGANGADAPPPPPGQVVDATGWPIPTHLIPLWQRSGEVQEWLTVLSRLKGVLRSAQEGRDMLFAEVRFSSALSQAEQLWTDLKTAKPFAVCPTCQGQVPEKCTLCRGRGLISEFRWNTCVPREDKEFRFRAKQKAESRK